MPKAIDKKKGRGVEWLEEDSQPSQSQRHGLSSPRGKKAKGSMRGEQVLEGDQKVDPEEEVKRNEVYDSKAMNSLEWLKKELHCPICCELMVVARTLPCSHSFCYFCLKKCLRQSKTCPLCREEAELECAVQVRALESAANILAKFFLSPGEVEERQLKVLEINEETKKKTPEKVEPASSTSDSESGAGENESERESSGSENNSEEDPDHSHYSYGVSRARNGRAQCRTCRRYISTRSLRWYISSTDHENPQWSRRHYHHLNCYSPPDHVDFGGLSVGTDLSRDERRHVKRILMER